MDIMMKLKKRKHILIVLPAAFASEAGGAVFSYADTLTDDSQNPSNSDYKLVSHEESHIRRSPR